MYIFVVSAHILLSLELTQPGVFPLSIQKKNADLMGLFYQIDNKIVTIYYHLDKLLVTV